MTKWSKRRWTCKYQDLARKIKRLWKVEARVIPSIIGTFGMIPRGLEENLRKLGITKS